jgi:hypothetical protein
MISADLLALPHLSVISRGEDPELGEIASRIDNKLFVDGRLELEELLGRLLALDAPITHKTLDLIGHSTAGQSLLVLGNWVIDAASPTVMAFFRELAEQEVLARLGVQAVRLLGCLTADTSHARSTLCTLAGILGVEVYGTTDLIFSAHYTHEGFASERRYLLVGASELREATRPAIDRHDARSYERVLDLDALPAVPLAPRPWPVKIASRDEASALLRLVRRRAGAIMPGLLTAPRCEVALPSAEPGRYYRAQVLFEGEFVRVYPDGAEEPGIVYPVEDAAALTRIVDRLPFATT